MVTSGERTRERSPQGEGARLREELIAAAGRLLAAGRGRRFAFSAWGGAGSRGRRAIGLPALREQGGAAARGGGRALHGIATSDRKRGGIRHMTRPLGSSPAVWPTAAMPWSTQVRTDILFNTPRPDIKDPDFAGTFGRGRIPDARRRRGRVHRGRGGAARRPVPHRDRYLGGAARDSLTAPGDRRVPLAAAGRAGARHTGGVHRDPLPGSLHRRGDAHDGAA